jgi:ABC-type dipeptide/oligopeptide/nickel transport system permease component
LFGVIDDFKRPSVRKVSTISGLATLTGFVLFTICIVFPYGSFGRKVESNFLRNYLASDDGKLDVPAFVGCVAACVAVAVSFPLQMLPMRRSVTALVYGAKGVPEVRIVWVHALRNISVPMVTVIALSYARLLEGAVLTETVFAWPGLGRYLTTALLAADMNAVLGATIVVGAIFVGINLLSDLLYRLLDPRSR